MDRHAKYADTSWFPQADQVLHVEPDEFARRAGTGAHAVLMHHNFDHDRDYLAALLESGARYLGVLGPLRRKLEAIRHRSASGQRLRLGGVGRGGEGPKAVAGSIVEEIQAVRHSRRGGVLRM